MQIFDGFVVEEACHAQSRQDLQIVLFFGIFCWQTLRGVDDAVVVFAVLSVEGHDLRVEVSVKNSDVE